MSGRELALRGGNAGGGQGGGYRGGGGSGSGNQGNHNAFPGSRTDDRFRSPPGRRKDKDKKEKKGKGKSSRKRSPSLSSSSSTDSKEKRRNRARTTMLKSSPGYRDYVQDLRDKDSARDRAAQSQSLVSALEAAGIVSKKPPEPLGTPPPPDWREVAAANGWSPVSPAVGTPKLGNAGAAPIFPPVPPQDPDKLSAAQVALLEEVSDLDIKDSSTDSVTRQVRKAYDKRSNVLAFDKFLKKRGVTKPKALDERARALVTALKAI